MTSPRTEEPGQTRISLWVPEDLRLKIIELAARNNRTFSGEIREALTRYMEAQNGGRKVKV